MQFLKIVLVALVLMVNLLIAQPSWAGKDFTKGADYAEVTQALNQLLTVKNTPEQAGYTPEQFQQRLAQLQSQKNVIETARKRAQCRNETGKTLAVYANKPKKFQPNSTFWAQEQSPMMIGIAMAFTYPQVLKWF
ncbi:hypothetical protein [Nostoc sp. 'Peltigera membranacea cyanobiont' 210A]|uniref:hypothetical protein n=1 Tax=Nostoc sp. 'Peltigera membranacea cyanobiont' 210A TaxID=2014529 RepID=UPI00269D9470|nr:hypothetical protein [Nostoc sp. 'Peltigera membranacea cyanobiont' 210A]